MPTATWAISILTVRPSPNNPNSTVGEKWKNYEITDADRERGYITSDGLTANSVYVIDVIDPRVRWLSMPSTTPVPRVPTVSLVRLSC